MRPLALIVVVAFGLSACQPDAEQRFDLSEAQSGTNASCATLILDPDRGAIYSARLFRGALLQAYSERGTVTLAGGQTVVVTENWRLAANQHLVCWQSLNSETSSYELERQFIEAAGG